MVIVYIGCIENIIADALVKVRKHAVRNKGPMFSLRYGTNYTLCI